VHIAVRPNAEFRGARGNWRRREELETWTCESTEGIRRGSHRPFFGRGIQRSPASYSGENYKKPLLQSMRLTTPLIDGAGRATVGGMGPPRLGAGQGLVWGESEHARTAEREGRLAIHAGGPVGKPCPRFVRLLLGGWFGARSRLECSGTGVGLVVRGAGNTESKTRSPDAAAK
jgi:hypothetical protein